MNEKISKRKRNIRGLDLVMILIVTSLGALFFLCITRSIGGVAIMNPWISAIICAIVFETFLSLFAVTVGRKRLIVPIVIIAFLPSIIFMPVVWHMIIVAVAMLVAVKGLYAMRATLFNMLKIDMSTIVRSGVAYVSLALVIVVTSQYYFFIKDNAETVFNAGHYVGTPNMVIDYIIKKSGVENVSISTMTVNDFLKFMMENVYKQERNRAQDSRFSNQEEGALVRWVGQTGGIDIEQIKDEAEDQVIEQMRTNMSEMTGRSLNGGEMVVDIFSEIISAQIDKVMTQNIFLRENKVIVFTVVFFLIIFSLAPIVRIVSVLCARFVFMLLREFKIVRVTKTKRDAEVIVL